MSAFRCRTEQPQRDRFGGGAQLVAGQFPQPYPPRLQSYQQKFEQHFTDMIECLTIRHRFLEQPVRDNEFDQPLRSQQLRRETPRLIEPPSELLPELERQAGAGQTPQPANRRV